MGIKDSIPPFLMRGAHTARERFYSASNARRFGAGVALTDSDSGSLLLMRLTYGDPEKWVFPGGGLPPLDMKAERKAPAGRVSDLGRYEATAFRELQEELGIDPKLVQNLGHLTTSFNERGPGRDLYAVFHGLVDVNSVPLKPQASEVAEMRLFDLDAIPDNIHHAVAAATAVLRNAA